MFFKGSRYEKSATYTVTTADGRQVSAVRPPAPTPCQLIGYHRRTEGQRLDHIAARYLRDATSFWQLCDSNQSVVPDALGARDLIGIPVKE